MAQSVLDQLRKLQQADQEVRRFEQQKAAQDRTLRLQADHIARQEGHLAALRAKHFEARKKADQKELEVRLKQAEIERLRQQQLQIRDNRQYTILQNEIKFAELAISKLEDDILADYEDIEGIEGEIAEAQGQLNHLRERLETLRKETEAKKAELNDQITGCRERRELTAQGLPRDTLDHFRRVADHTGGEAMARVVRDEEDGTFACSGCHMSVTQNTYVMLVGRNEEIVTCPNCTRIFYLENS